MTTAECIRQRVSCRRFQETPIPREDIRRVVDLARFSPSWKNTQPVRYIVIDDAMFIGDVMPSKAENGEKPEK